MKHRLAAILSLATPLSACASIQPSVRQCEQAINGLATAAEIAQVLIRYGYAPEAAQKAAAAIAAVQMGVTVACAASVG